MPTAQLAAKLFAALVGVVVAFQLALALGAPWGQFAMGGAVPGVYPPAMRVAAVLQIGLLIVVALIVLSRAGLCLSAWRSASQWLVWPVVGLLALSVALNLMTPSPMERLIWTPVAVGLFAAALRVAAANCPPQEVASPVGDGVHNVRSGDRR